MGLVIKIQEGFDSYYDLCFEGDEEGCCLLCPEQEEGCLCFECKCTKCYWYIPPEDYRRKDIVIIQLY